MKLTFLSHYNIYISPTKQNETKKMNTSFYFTFHFFSVFDLFQSLLCVFECHTQHTHTHTHTHTTHYVSPKKLGKIYNKIENKS